MASVKEKLVDSDDVYNRSWELFNFKSQTKTVVVSWLNNNINGVLVKIKHSRSDKEFNILSVGCHAGDKDMVILENVKKILDNEEVVNYSAVEPNIKALNIFEQNVSQHSWVHFTKHDTTFQNYIKNADLREQNYFDFVHFIQSIYYTNAEESLLHCYSKELKENGTILCILQHPESGIVQFYNTLLEHNIVPYDSRYVLYTTSSLVNFAEKNKWKYDLFKIRYKIDVTECFDESSEDGNLLLDFLLHLRDCRRNESEERIKEIMDSLEGLCTVSNNKKILVAFNGVILIHKTNQEDRHS